MSENVTDLQRKITTLTEDVIPPLVDKKVALQCKEILATDLQVCIDRVSYFLSILKNMFWVLSCKIQTFSSIPDNLSLPSNSIFHLEEKVTNYLFIIHSKINKIASRADDVIKYCKYYCVVLSSFGETDHQTIHLLVITLMCLQLWHSFVYTWKHKLNYYGVLRRDR